ncbi:MAG: glycosyltransferase family 2 protein [Myxococcota bacterium]
MDAQPPVRLSVVIALRDRAGFRLENCLRALRWQTLASEAFEIVLSDFGSDPTSRAEVVRLAEQHRARVVYTETRERWNKSRALNIGVRAALGHYVLCTDADMIFAPNFLETLLDVQAQGGDRAFVLCQSRDLPEGLAERLWTVDDLPSLVGQSQYRARQGTGACQMATRAFFERVRGYDEGYKGWGQEDTDMTFRAARAGLTHRWVEGSTAMMHQWHPSNRHRWPIQKALNDLRYHLTKRRITKNRRSWGLAP